MPNEEDVVQQQALLLQYRRTLSHYLMQMAIVGVASAQPSLINGIYETQEHIRRIKKILRSWSVVVDDHPDDDGNVFQSYDALPTPSTRTLKQIGVVKANGHVFLSYTRNDQSSANVIRRVLEAAGYLVWQDNTSIKGGEEWVQSIEAGIDGAYAVVSIVSVNSEKSDWMKIEFLHAQRRKKRIIPVQIDDTEIPFLMLIYNVIHAHRDLLGGATQVIQALLSIENTMSLLTSSDKRQLEIDYIDRLLLEYSVWQVIYTPMAGVASIVKSPRKKTVKRQASHITALFKPLDERIDKAFKEAPEIIHLPFTDITQAVNAVKQLVVLGEPGSGKTTTLWKIAADYAEMAKNDTAAPLPLILRLSTMSATLTLTEQLQQVLGPLPLDILLQEKRIAILLDGLNELSYEDREHKVDQLHQLLERALQDDIVTVVTCRELDYQEELDLHFPQRVRIEPLSPDRIHQFCVNYLPDDGEALFWQIGGEILHRYWMVWQQEQRGDFASLWTSDDLCSATSTDDDKGVETLRKVMRGEEPSRELLCLARNPYMLFMMTEVYAERGSLPRNRSKLFDVFIDYLLCERERLSLDDAETLRTKLGDLAFSMQRGKVGTLIKRGDVEAFLSPIQLHNALCSNMLMGSDTLHFSHQLLQEHFAAQRLNAELKAGTPAIQLFEFENWWVPQGWEETVILLAGMYGEDCTTVILWLCDIQPELAARCILESGAYTPPETLVILQQKWLPRLTDLESDPMPPARAAVGRAVGLLKLDTRHGVGLQNGIPDIDWIIIPEGTFVMGSDSERDPQTSEDELPQCEIYLPSYQISRYPITYLQFSAFIENDGYTQRDYWTDAGWIYKEREKLVKPFYWDNQAENICNNPVTGVTWYEAVAYCKWLSTILEYEVRLPTEQEWEKAARATDGRIYPYGDVFDPEKSNSDYSGIKRACAVGLFLEGSSPYGVLDCSGNVWEWCLTKWTRSYREEEDNRIEGKEKRVLRGGSWWDKEDIGRVTCRSKFEPHIKFDDGGFRIVRSSYSPKLLGE